MAAGQEPEEQQDLAQHMDLQDENSKEGCQGGDSIQSTWINPSVQEHLQDAPAGPQEGKMKALKASTLLLLLGLFSFGVYHMGRLGALTPWSTADLSETLPLPDQLHKLQERLYHLRWSAKDVTERALQEGLKQAKFPGVTGRAVQEIVNEALEKLEAIQVPMADYALKSAGAAVIQSRTSPSLRTAKAKVFWYSLPVMDYMRSPELILEPDNHPGNCWPFPGSQGHVFIKLSMPVIPRAITMAHVSGTAFHGESISGAPKDFAVYAFKEEHEEQGTFLGQFTFLAALNPSQTFQLKNELPGVVNYIRLQVLSNWGHPDYTCLYRFRVHGDPPRDGGDVPVSSINKFL
ncbi:SUN domain-containing protein 3 [Columba livia]|uniref:SUN domain-containing protein 3 n=1 Tax=Columba livia TaxID=8932 RepID=UPI0031BACB80